METTDSHWIRGSCKPSQYWPLIALTLFAFVARAWGIDHQLPHRIEPDPQAAQQANILANSGGEDAASDANSAVMAKYPWLLARLAGLGLTDDDHLARASAPTLEEHLARASAPTLSVRWWVALFGVLTVPLTWLLGRLWIGAGAGLLAAAFVATSVLHLDFSQQARPHIPVTTWILLTVVAAMIAARERHLFAWTIACVAAGLALGTLHNGVAAFVPLAAVIWIRARSDGWPRTLPLLIHPLVAIGIALWLFYPFAFQSGVGGQAAQMNLDGTTLRYGTHVVDLGMFNGQGFVAVFRNLWHYEPLLTIGVLLGAGAGLLRLRNTWHLSSRPQAVAGLAFVLPYLLVVGIYSRTYQRFLLPLLPFAALLAAGGWKVVAGMMERRRILRPGPAVALAALLLVAPAGATCLRQSWLRSRPDTYESLVAWIETNLDPEHESLYLHASLMMPAVFQTDDMAAQTPMPKDASSRIFWSCYQGSVPAQLKPAERWNLRVLEFRDPDWARRIRAGALEFLSSLPAGYVLTEALPRQSSAKPEPDLQEALRRLGRKVHRIRPRVDRRAAPRGKLGLESILSPRPLRLWRMDSLGPFIEVYRIPR